MLGYLRPAAATTASVSTDNYINETGTSLRTDWSEKNKVTSSPKQTKRANRNAMSVSMNTQNWNVTSDGSPGVIVGSPWRCEASDFSGFSDGVFFWDCRNSSWDLCRWTNSTWHFRWLILQFFPSSRPDFFTGAQTETAQGDAYIANRESATSRNGLDRWFQASCALMSSKPHYTDQ